MKAAIWAHPLIPWLLHPSLGHACSVLMAHTPLLLPRLQMPQRKAEPVPPGRSLGVVRRHVLSSISFTNLRAVTWGSALDSCLGSRRGPRLGLEAHPGAAVQKEPS